MSEQTYPGFGIGLFIASKIIAQYTGNISVEGEKENDSYLHRILYDF